METPSHAPSGPTTVRLTPSVWKIRTRTKTQQTLFCPTTTAQRPKLSRIPIPTRPMRNFLRPPIPAKASFRLPSAKWLPPPPSRTRALPPHRNANGNGDARCAKPRAISSYRRGICSVSSHDCCYLSGACSSASSVSSASIATSSCVSSAPTSFCWHSSSRLPLSSTSTRKSTSSPTAAPAGTKWCSTTMRTSSPTSPTCSRRCLSSSP